MRIKMSELDVPAGNPFANDTLERRENAEMLTALVKSISEPLVIGIDAAWGQGKTTFLKMWSQLLRDNDFPVIYYSAWENDFTDNALVSLIGEISAALDDLRVTGDKSQAADYFEKAKRIGAGILKRSVPVALKVATAGVLDASQIVDDAVSSAVEQFASDQIEQYENSKDSLKNFKKELAGFASHLSDKDIPTPLIFIIDELDRCRPIYAIELLEKAKHFFNVENIVFVLGIDRTQLGHSIKAVYGNDFEVNGYLKRFIDIEYSLPAPKKGAFIKALYNKYNFDDYFQSRKEYRSEHDGIEIRDRIAEFSIVFNLSLREQEHCCYLLNLAIRITPPNYKLYPPILSLLMVFKIKRPDLYKLITDISIDRFHIMDLLKNDAQANKLFLDSQNQWLEAKILTFANSRHDYKQVIEYFDNIFKSENSSQHEKDHAYRMMEIINRMDINRDIGTMQYLVNKIDMISDFH